MTETAEQRINQRHYSKEKVGDFIELAFGEDARKSYYDMLPALEFEDADMKASMFIMSVRARGYSISNVDIAVALNILRYAGDRPAIETTISAEAQIPLQIIGDQFTFLTKPDVAGSFVIDYVDNPFSWLIPAAIRELEVRSEPGSPIRIAVTRIGDQHRHHVQKQNPPRRASRIHHA